MNLKKLLFRNEQLQTTYVFEAWEVRWTSRHGEYGGDTQPEMRIFPSKEEAEDFKKALEDAFKLIKHTSGTEVQLIKQEI